ncbi:hypothetical protein W823_07680 [Williamsia sp. D3]|nr:hypothetical protein W823_07680 [Williamsia sp. D3]
MHDHGRVLGCDDGGEFGHPVLMTFSPHSSFVLCRAAIFTHQVGVAAEYRRVDHVSQAIPRPGSAATELISDVAVDGFGVLGSLDEICARDDGRNMVRRKISVFQHLGNLRESIAQRQGAGEMVLCGDLRQVLGCGEAGRAARIGIQVQVGSIDRGVDDLAMQFGGGHVACPFQVALPSHCPLRRAEQFIGARQRGGHHTDVPLTQL